MADVKVFEEIIDTACYLIDVEFPDGRTESVGFSGDGAQALAAAHAADVLGRPWAAEHKPRVFRRAVATHRHFWAVEETDSQGYVHRAEFTGPSAEREAKDYAARKGLPEVIADMEAIVRQFHAALEGRANG
jgi:hypothetical protein